MSFSMPGSLVRLLFIVAVGTAMMAWLYVLGQAALWMVGA
jgi:hypothetical protein